MTDPVLVVAGMFSCLAFQLRLVLRAGGRAALPPRRSGPTGPACLCLAAAGTDTSAASDAPTAPVPASPYRTARRRLGAVR